MKKTLIAVAALVATGAFAQATVYGRLDVGYSQNTTTLTGAQDVKDNGINNNGLNTSYWGIVGSEDLGGGMKANFKLETNVGVDTGAAMAGFDRVSKLGVSGGFGSVDLGLDYTPFFQLASAVDVFNQAATTTVNATSLKSTVAMLTAAGATPAVAAAGDTVRQPNAIHYTSPNFSGLTVKVMYGPNLSTNSPATTETKNTATGGSVVYANGPLMVGAAINTIQVDTTTIVSGASTTVKTESNAISASYDLGKAKILGGLINTKNTDGTPAANKLELKEINLGVSVPMGAVTLLASVGKNTLSYAGSDDFTGTDMMIGATYELSKRTALYAKTGTFNKIDFTGGVDTKTNTTAVGVRHLF